MDPNFELVHERIALVYLAQGREEEAWKEIQFLGDCRKEASDCRRFWTAYLPKRDPAAAREALLWLEDESKIRRIPLSVFVQAHARQGNYGRALDWLEQMLENHEVWLITLKVNPLFDPLRTQPRFQRVLQKLNLTE
jgi:pentatricopeptide repeat protein